MRGEYDLEDVKKNNFMFSNVTTEEIPGSQCEEPATTKHTGHWYRDPHYDQMLELDRIVT